MRELDAMTDQHWQSALAILGVPHAAAMSGAPLASNWKRFRSEFNAVDAGKILRGNTQAVVEILLQPPKSPPAKKMLHEFSIRELDAMTDKHWQSTLALLGVPHAAAMSGAPLASNWRRLRSEFNAVDAGKLLLSNTRGVLELLLEPPKSPKSPPRAGQQEQRSGTGTQSNTARPPADRAGAAAEAKASTLPPISIVGMGKESARQALQERGMNMEKFKQMKFDFHQHVNHGDARSGQLLNKKYGAYVSDDLTSSKSYASYARMLQGI
ncbi:hypothetical protein [Collimonas silvisoli]|uniref:hypothetical protein n=1 Tax=Collimonas silvisoli TaxID=2825884 RepID=UPI001B8C77C0|nr:hypothetical protein [Collimonas silvisoli]